MASLIRPTRPYPLPPAAEIVAREGKKHVRLTESGRKVLYPLTRDGTCYLKPAKKWYGQYTDAGGATRRVPLSANKEAARQMLAELVKKAELEKAGVSDPFAAHRTKPLAEHLAAWERSLAAGGSGGNYISQKVKRAGVVVAACQAAVLADLTAERVELALASLRSDDGHRPVVPDQPQFTKAEAAALLGVSPVAFQALVRRHRLPAVGAGKARRYPRGSVAFLADRRPGGRGVQTMNHWLDAVKSFTRWLVENGRLAANPLLRLKGGNTRLDPRHRRGELTATEVSALVRTAAASTTAYRGLSGSDRAMLYRVALGTGFRRAELAALTPACFRLDADQPVVHLSAGRTKNRQAAALPVPSDLAAVLRTYLDGRDPKRPIWSGGWATRSADMIRRDLHAADIAYTVESTDGTEYRDFHSLRATYISNVIRAGATIKEAMTLARHSDPKLTAGRYARAQLRDLGVIADRLAAPADAQAYALPDALAGDAGCGQMNGGEGDRSAPLNPGNSDEVLKNQAVAGDCGAVMADEDSTPDRIRTCDPRFRKPMLYPLSYGGQGRFSVPEIAVPATRPEFAGQRAVTAVGSLQCPHRPVASRQRARTRYSPASWNTAAGMSAVRPSATSAFQWSVSSYQPRLPTRPTRHSIAVAL